MSDVLVLCHGNYMRSPAAEAVLRAEGLDAVSAGFRPTCGRAAKKMRVAMAARGYDLEAHRPRLVTIELARAAKHILVMDDGNLKRYCDLEAAEGDVPARVTNLGQYIGLPRIKDPAFLGNQPAQFEQIVKNIIEASKAFAQCWRAGTVVTL